MRRRARQIALAVAATAAAAGATATPAPAATVPCIDLGLIKAGDCRPPGGSVGDEPVRETSGGCADVDLLPTRSNLARIRSATLCLLNGERTARGLGRLRQQRTLRTVALRYARHMVAERFFAHTSPGGSTMLSRLKRTSYLRGATNWAVGENLAWGTGDRSTPGQTVRAWMNSPGHRRNILDRRFREIGIGITAGAPAAARGSSTAATYVTEFGRRR